MVWRPLFDRRIEPLMSGTTSLSRQHVSERCAVRFADPAMA